MNAEYKQQVDKLRTIYDEFISLLDSKDSDKRSKVSEFIKQLETIHTLVGHIDPFYVFFCEVMYDVDNGEKPNHISVEELLRIISLSIYDLKNALECSIFKYENTLKFILWLVLNVCIRLNIELAENKNGTKG